MTIVVKNPNDLHELSELDKLDINTDNLNPDIDPDIISDDDMPYAQEIHEINQQINNKDGQITPELCDQIIKDAKEKNLLSDEQINYLTSIGNQIVNDVTNSQYFDQHPEKIPNYALKFAASSLTSEISPPSIPALSSSNPSSVGSPSSVGASSSSVDDSGSSSWGVTNIQDFDDEDSQALRTLFSSNAPMLCKLMCCLATVSKHFYDLAASDAKEQAQNTQDAATLNKYSDFGKALQKILARHDKDTRGDKPFKLDMATLLDALHQGGKSGDPYLDSLYNDAISDVNAAGGIALLSKLKQGDTLLWADNNNPLTKDDAVNILENLTNSMKAILEAHGSTMDTSAFSLNKDTIFYGDVTDIPTTPPGIYRKDGVYYQVDDKGVSETLNVTGSGFEASMKKGQSYPADQLSAAFNDYTPTTRSPDEIIAAFDASFKNATNTGDNSPAAQTATALGTANTTLNTSMQNKTTSGTTLLQALKTYLEMNSTLLQKLM